MEWLFLIFLVPLALVVHGSIVRNRWGINFARVVCPSCGTPAPLVRSPDSMQQGLWGGFTCRACGTGMDKWGRQVSPPTKPLPGVLPPA